MVRASKLVLRLAAGVLTLAAVAFAALGLLLLSGPISLSWLTPYIESAAVSEAIPHVEIEDVRLRLADESGLELVAVGVRGVDRRGQALFEVPEIGVTPDLRALAVDRVLAPSRLNVVAPEIVVTRRSDGSIGVGGDDDERSGGASADEIGPTGAERLLAALLEPAGSDDPVAYVERVRVSGGVLRLEDRVLGRTVEAEGAELLIQREAEGLSVRLGFDLEQPGGPARTEAEALVDRTNRRVTFDVEIGGLDLGELGATLGDESLRGLSLVVDGRFGGTYRLDGVLSVIGFELSATSGAIELPDLLARPLAIDSIELKGEIAGDLDAVRVERLTVRHGDARLTGEGEVGWGAAGPSLTAEIEAANLSARDLDLYWPPAAEPMAREWVVENITEGVVPRARASLRFEPGDLDQKPVPEHTIEGSFDFESLTVGYFAPLPPIRGVDGEASFTARRMDFTVTSGHVDELVIQDGSVTITGMGLPGRDTTQLEIRTTVDGPIAQAIALIDHEPLGLAGEIGLDPAGLGGRARTDLAIGMPLHKDFDAADIRVAAESALVDASWIGLRAGVDLEQGQLRLRVDGDRLQLSGDAEINGIPLRVEWFQPLTENASFRYRIEGEVAAADLARLDLEAPVPLEGKVGVEAEVTERAGITVAELALDLAPLGIAVDQLGWHKPVGQSGTLKASIRVAVDEPIAIESFDLATATLEATGDLTLRPEPLVLDQLRLSRLRLEGSDAEVAVRRADDGSYVARIEAGTLNLDQLLAARESDGASDEEPAEHDASDAEAADPVSLELDVQARKVVLLERELHDVRARLMRGHTGWQSASVEAVLPDGGRVDLALVPEGEGHRLQITGDDAGGLIRFIDPGATVRGGSAELTATIHRQRPSLMAEGVLRAQEFTLVEAPVLARLLTLTSFTGIRNLLGGEGIYFDRLKIPFNLDGQALSVTDGRMSGSQLGLTVDGRIDLAADELALNGTIVPVYTINRLLGSVPIVGDFLKGTKGEGAFAATYRIRGPTEDPSLTVNPLAVLAPGFVRELFGGLLDGSLEPPGAPSGD